MTMTVFVGYDPNSRPKECGWFSRVASYVNILTFVKCSWSYTSTQLLSDRMVPVQCHCWGSANKWPHRRRTAHCQQQSTWTLWPWGGCSGTRHNQRSWPGKWKDHNWSSDPTIQPWQLLSQYEFTFPSKQGMASDWTVEPLLDTARLRREQQWFWDV